MPVDTTADVATLPTGFVELLRVEVGSTAHGIGVGDDDLDQMGVCIEPPEYTIGGKSYRGQAGFEQFEFRTAWQRHGIVSTRHQPQPKSEPGDLDLNIYSLRKWCRMALSGNPTTLLLLYSPKVAVETAQGTRLRALHDAFRSRHVGTAYARYLDRQRARLIGTKGQKDVNRPELVESFGYDVKYAAHVIRLGVQGCEYLQTGQLSVPMREADRDLVRAVRRGSIPFADVVRMADELERHLHRLIGSVNLQLPPEPDTARVQRFLVDTYQDVWKGQANAETAADRQ